MAKGKRVRYVNLKKESPSEDELLQLMTGPTGKLRAPTIRLGKKLFIGFNADEFPQKLMSEE